MSATSEANGSPTEEAFRADAKAFLDANARVRGEVKVVWGEGEDDFSILNEQSAEEERAEVEGAKAWRQKLFDAGFGWITGPEEYGGRALPRRYQEIYGEVESAYEVPSTAPLGIGLGMVAPTILAHATDEVKDSYLKPLWRGEIVACQLFSEPGAGSDLASLATSADRDGDEWIINGQKVWTSGAQYSDIGEIICRTDPTLPKHKGLTGFVVDMKAPGVEVRPLRQMTGGASFNEVFFSDVRVPDSHRLGDVNQGWSVALTTLMNERAAIGGGSVSGGGAMSVSLLTQMLQHFGLAEHPTFRDELANVYAHLKVAAWTNQRAMAKIKAGQLPGPEMSIAKLSLTKNLALVTELVSRALGPRIAADSGEWGTFAWSQLVLGLPGLRVAGGTDEVMRNIIGERVLGLPKEPPAVR